MGSNKGFVRKYDTNGGVTFTKADFFDQITEVVYDPRQLIITNLNTWDTQKYGDICYVPN